MTPPHPKQLDLVFFTLTLLCGIIILSPYLDYQQYLTPGDMGWHLYVYDQTMDGQFPFKDYLWYYGPLMNYYYALFLKIFGVNISSILLGRVVLNLLSGVFCYLAVRVFFHPVSAFLCALWLMAYHPDVHFIYTYNHAGGITCFIILTYILFRYLKDGNMRDLLLAAGVIWLIFLIKFNFGVTALLGYFLSVWLIDSVFERRSRRKRMTFISFCLVGAVTLTYAFFFWGLDADALRQSFLYVQGEQLPQTSMAKNIVLFFQSCWETITLTVHNLLTAVVVLTVFFMAVFRLLSDDKDVDLGKRKTYVLVLAILFIFLILNLHEFLLSGVYYRKYWAVPYQIMLMCVLTAIAVEGVRTARSTKVLVSLFFLYGIIAGFFATTTGLSAFKNPAYFLSWKRARIYTTMPPDWQSTVSKTLDYLQTHLEEEETFLALPYEPLYYYLLDKKSPHRITFTFDFLRITDEQEQEIITALEQKRVNYILVSNRVVSNERGLGIFGKTYTHRLAKYIKEHYKAVARFGDWTKPAGWWENHAILILKRK